MEHWYWYLLIAVALIVIISGYVMACPSCSKWWARKSKSKSLIDSKGAYKTITRYDIRRDSTGKEIGRTERQEQVHVVRNTYQNQWQCKHCHHEWSTISTSEYEG